MGFSEGNKLGQLKLGMSGAVKRKYLAKWQEVFDQDPIETLEKIKKEDPAEFIRLGIAAMPKEIDVQVDIFGGMDDDALQKFIVDRLKRLRNQK